MKSTKLSPSSLFIICLCLLFNVVVPTLSLKLYEIVCKEARQDEKVCLQLLQGEIKIAAATNYKDLSNRILDLAVFKTILAQQYVANLAKQNPTNAAFAQCANDFYNKSKYAFISAFGELDKDPQSAKNDAKAAGDGVASCEKAIQKGRFDSGVHARNNEIF